MKKSLFILFLALLSNCFIAQINVTQSLTACYALNGNGFESVNNFTGTLSAVTPTVDRFNTPNSALYLNGTASSYIELPDDPLLKPSNAISFSLWIKPAAVNTQYVVFTKNTAWYDFEAYELSITTQFGPPIFRLRKGTGPTTIVADGTATVLVNTWYHIVGTIDNSALNLYVNGNLAASVLTNIPFNYHPGRKVYLGGSNEPTFNIPYNGSIDNVRFYNRVITPMEVTELYSREPECPAGTVTMLKEINNTGYFEAYPNPSQGKFAINSTGNINKIEVVDMLGKTVLITGNTDQIDISNQPSGIYFLKLNVEGQTLTYKIVKD